MLALFSLIASTASAVWLFRRRGEPLRWRRSAVWLLCLATLGAAIWHWPPYLIWRKIVATLLMPTALTWLALIAAFLLSRRQRAARAAIGVLLAGYTLAGNDWVVGHALRGLEAPYLESRPLADGRTYEAVFVHGGGASVAADGSPQLSVRGDRLRLPAALYHAGRTPLLVTSGTGLSGLDHAALTRRLWVSLGVPADAILSLPAPLNTEQEIAAYSRMIRERGWHTVGLVTSASHMRRAQAHCRQYGLQMFPLPTDFRSGSVSLGWRDLLVRGHSNFFWLVPNGKAFAALETALWEYLGLAALWLSER